MRYLAVAAFGVKGAGTGCGVECIETDGISGPGLGDDLGFFQQKTADAFALESRKDGHAGQVQRPFGRGEIRYVDGPGFLGGEAQCADDATVGAGNQDSREFRPKHVREDSPLCGGRRPEAVTELASQRLGGSAVKGCELGCIRVGGSGKDKFHCCQTGIGRFETGFYTTSEILVLSTGRMGNNASSSASSGKPGRSATL